MVTFHEKEIEWLRKKWALCSYFYKDNKTAESVPGSNEKYVKNRTKLI